MAMFLAHLNQTHSHVLANTSKSNVHTHYKFCMSFLFTAANAVGGAADLKDLKDNFLLVCDSLGEQVRASLTKLIQEVVILIYCTHLLAGH